MKSTIYVFAAKNLWQPTILKDFEVEFPLRKEMDLKRKKIK
jgi:hypothetical protein